MNRLQDGFDDDDAGDDVNDGMLFECMRHDPAMPLSDFAPRHFSPTVKAWAQEDPSGYVDGLNAYAAPIDEPVNYINPLDT